MNHLVLARKWRPKSFSDVIGQNHITQSLINSLKRQQMGHAYLLTGTRGIGKTTVARIFAKSLRCENKQDGFGPCLKCTRCISIDSDRDMDVIELDGASHNGVDQIRDLVDTVKYLPADGPYKIYIIDEVHMLTKEAFNALLKTLEAPPSYVVFIFATTNPEKILDTVLSRCQRFDFRNVTLKELKNHLFNILSAEGISVEDDIIIKTIAQEANGSVRDALSLLDQVLNFSTDNIIKSKVLVDALGLASRENLKELVVGIVNSDPARVTEIFHKISYGNIDFHKFLSSILDEFYSIIQKSLKNELGEEYCELDESVNIEELYWIYECLVKDITWSTKGPNLTQTILIILQKISLRRQFFKVDNEKKSSDSNITAPKNLSKPVTQKAKIEVVKEESLKEVSKKEVSINVAQEVLPEKVEKITEISNSLNVEKKMKKAKDWSGFLDYLSLHSKALRANLEQGNILESVDLDRGKLEINLGFDDNSEVFMDYIKDVKQRVLSHMGNYFQRAPELIDLKLVMMNPKEAQLKNFMSVAELEEKKIKKAKEDIKKDLMSNTFVQEAENIFGSKIDQITVEDE